MYLHRLFPLPGMSSYSLTHQNSAPRKLSWTTLHRPVLPSSKPGANLHHSLRKWDICLSHTLRQVVSSKKVGVLFMFYLQPLAWSLAQGKCSISIAEWIDKWVLLFPLLTDSQKSSWRRHMWRMGSEKQQDMQRVLSAHYVAGTVVNEMYAFSCLNTLCSPATKVHSSS